MDDETPNETGDKSARKVKSGHRKTISPDTLVEEIDEAKVAKALAYITAEKAKSTKNNLDEAMVIGDYLYTEFFQRNPHSYSNKGRTSPSLRALLKRPELRELRMSLSTIANYITVVIQRDRFESLIANGKLPPRVRSLDLTQRIRLLPCRRAVDEARIAVRAVDEELKGPQVQALVTAANAGKTPAARSPESEVVRGVKRIYKDVAEVAGLDLGAASDGDLAALDFFGVRSAKALNELAAYAKGELASRPGARAPTAMDAFGAETPDELDALMQATTGEDLGLGPAIRRGATKVIQGLGAEILANLEHADPKAVREWFLDFVVVAAAKLGAPDDLREKLRSNPVKSPAKSSPPTKGRRTWFVIFGRDAAAREEEPGSLFNLLDTRAKLNKCIVQAVDEDDAATQFRQRGQGLDPDVDDPAKEIRAERFNSAGAAKVSVATYLLRPPSERLPTLDEFVTRALVTSNPSG